MPAATAKSLLEPIAQDGGIALDELLERIATALATWAPDGRVRDERVSVTLDDAGALVVACVGPGYPPGYRDDRWRQRLPAAWREASDPTARRALRALLPPVEAIQVRSGSIAELLSSGALDGLRVEDGADRLEIVWTACEAILETAPERRRAWMAVRARGTARDRAIDAYGSETYPPDAFPLALPAHPAAVARARETLADLLHALKTDERNAEDGVLRGVLGAALPEIAPDSRAGWFERALPAQIGAVVEGPISVVFTASALDREPRSFGALKMTMQMVVRDGAEIVDVKEQELWLGAIDLEDLALPAPDPAHPHVRGALELWRQAQLDKLRALPDAGERLPHEIVPGEITPAGLVATWLEKGPPGPRPERLVIGELARTHAGALRRVEPGLFHDLDRRVLAAYEVGGWHVLLAPHVRRPQGFEEDRIRIVSPDGADALVLMSDPWNAPVAMTIDGDGVAFRGFATWLRDAILARGLDVEWDEPPDPDEIEEGEDPAPDRRSVSRFLRFRDGWREELGERLWDWRVQYETVVDGWAYWQSGIFGFDDEQKRVFEGGIAVWHRFLREVVDPGFVGRADPVG